MAPLQKRKRVIVKVGPFCEDEQVIRGFLWQIRVEIRVENRVENRVGDPIFHPILDPNLAPQKPRITCGERVFSNPLELRLREIFYSPPRALFSALLSAAMSATCAA